MRNNYFLKTVCLLCLTFIFGQQVFAQKTGNLKTAENKALQKSLKKLKTSLSKFGTYPDENISTKSYRIKPISFKGCEVLFGYEEVISMSSPSTLALRNEQVVLDSIRYDRFLSPTYRSLVKLDFAKLDPTTAKLITGEKTRLLVQSLENQKAIEEKDSQTIKSLREISIPISYEKAADEIQKLFMDVIHGCQTPS